MSLWNMFFMLRAVRVVNMRAVSMVNPSMVRMDKCHDLGKLIVLDGTGDGCRQSKGCIAGLYMYHAVDKA